MTTPLKGRERQNNRLKKRGLEGNITLLFLYSFFGENHRV
jgi:hypothetical protein